MEYSTKIISFTTQIKINSTENIISKEKTTIIEQQRFRETKVTHFTVIFSVYSRTRIII